MMPDVPDGVYSNEKAKRLLGFKATDKLTDYFTRRSTAAKL